MINTFDPVFGGATQYVVNAGKAKVYGVELEVTALPWRGMTINSSIARQHAAYVDGSFVETQIVGGVPVTVDRSAERVPQAPKFTANIGATQAFDMPFGDLTLHADYAYISSRAIYQATAAAQLPQATRDQFDAASRLGVIPGYGLLNGRIAARFADNAIEAAVWGRNLTKKRYFNHISNFYTGFGPVQVSQGDPRTYGVTLSYRY